MIGVEGQVKTIRGPRLQAGIADHDYIGRRRIGVGGNGHRDSGHDVLHVRTAERPRIGGPRHEVVGNRVIGVEAGIEPTVALALEVAALLVD